jgi:hypothetical protein
MRRTANLKNPWMPEKDIGEKQNGSEPMYILFREAVLFHLE